MSLRSFHICFITAAVLLTIGFFAWTKLAPARRVTPEIATMGVVSLVLSVLLVIYGIWFVRKNRKLLSES